jgi:hypothetical protein
MKVCFQKYLIMSILCVYTWHVFNFLSASFTSAKAFRSSNFYYIFCFVLFWGHLKIPSDCYYETIILQTYYIRYILKYFRSSETSSFWCNIVSFQFLASENIETRWSPSLPRQSNQIIFLRPTSGMESWLMVPFGLLSNTVSNGRDSNRTPLK